MTTEQNAKAKVARWEDDAAAVLHPAWLAFIRFCAELRHGELDRVAIQDGLPVLAEVTKKKVKFT